MKKRELKEMIKQMVRELTEEESLDEDGIGGSAGMMPANATPNISGYDAPFGTMVKRRLNGKTKKGRRKNKQ